MFGLFIVGIKEKLRKGTKNRNTCE